MKISIFVLLTSTLAVPLSAQSRPQQPMEINFRSSVRALRFSRDGSKLLTATSIYKKSVSSELVLGQPDTRLRVYSPHLYKEIWVLPTRPIRNGPVLLMPDFKTMLTSWGAAEIKPVAIHSYRLGPFISVMSGSIGSFTLSPDENIMAVGMTRAVEIRDARTHKVMRTYEHGGQGTRVQFGPRGTTLLCSWGGPHPHCISVKTARQVRWPRWVYRVRDADAWTFSSDGSLLACANGKTVEMWETPTEESKFAHRRRIFNSSLERVTELAFAPDGKTLAVGGFSQTTMPVQFFSLS